MNALEEFKSILHDFGMLAVGATGASTAIPFVASFLSVVPPWPVGLEYISGVFQFLVLIFAFSSYRSARRFSSGTYGLLLIVSLALFLIYAFVFSQFTIFIPEAKRSIVVGYQCTQDAAKVYPEKCPFLSADELMGAKYDEFILWTKMSIGLIRVSLIALWLAMLLVIDLLICRFVVEASGIKARR